MINKRRFEMVAAGTVLAMHLGAAPAATVQGVVTSDDTGDPIEASVNAYRWLTGVWVNVAASRSSPVTGAFRFSSLPAGTYYFFTQPLVETNYVGEYYDDTTDWDLKTEVVLAAADNKNLGGVGLSLKPFYMEDVATDVNIVPATGGEVRIEGTAINTSPGPITAVYWVNVVTPNPDTLGLGYFTPGAITSIRPQPVSLPTGPKNFSIVARIPDFAPNNRVYHFDLTIGLNAADPIATERAGPVWKTSDPVPTSPTPLSTPPAAQQTYVPIRLTAEGDVLEWGSPTPDREE